MPTLARNTVRKTRQGLQGLQQSMPVAFGRSTDYAPDRERRAADRHASTSQFWHHALKGSSDFQPTSTRNLEMQYNDLDARWLEWNAKQSQRVSDSMRFRTALAISIHSSGREYGQDELREEQQEQQQEQHQEHELGEWSLTLGPSGTTVVHQPVEKPPHQVVVVSPKKTDRRQSTEQNAVAILLFEKYFRHMEEAGQGRLDAAAAKRVEVQQKLQDRWADSPEPEELPCIAAQRKSLELHRGMSRQENESEEDDEDEEEWYLDVGDRNVVPSFSLGSTQKQKHNANANDNGHLSAVSNTSLRRLSASNAP